MSNENRLNWLKWRKSGIGSSDAAAIHGESPYITKLELYNDKFVDTEVVDEESSYITDRGNQLEPLARRLFAAEFNIMNNAEETFEAKNFSLKQAPFMKASLDGISKDGTVGIEIKFQGLKAHQEVKNGVIPRHYWIQIQHQLIVTGARVIYLVSCNPKDEKNKIYYTPVYMDAAFAQKHIDACSEFWMNGKKGEAPEPSKDDFVLLRKSGLTEKAKRFAEIKKLSAELEQEMDEIKAEIEAACEHPKMRIGPLRILKIDKAGSIDYAKVPEVKALEKSYLEGYRKAGSSYFKFTIEE